MLDLSVVPEVDVSQLPPVESWSPAFCGDMDLLIKSNGDWIHEGVKIKRQAMVNLFSRILWLESDAFFLVTPVEKVRIQVEDAPFLVTEWRFVGEKTQENGMEKGALGNVIEFVTSTGDVMRLGEDCDIWMASYENKEVKEERPYISMRYGMKAMLHHHVFYDLANYLEPVKAMQGEGMGIISAGRHYLLMPYE